MDFDIMLEELGELGTYQITVYILVCFPVLFAAANSLSYVFTAGVPDYRCFIPECDDADSPSFHQEWLSWAIPQDSSATGKEYVASHCEKFIPNPTSDNRTCRPSAFSGNVTRCDEWVFSDERTIVNDWGITCLENQWKLSLVGTSHFAGIIVGSATFGILADRYGRKLILIFCILLMSLSGVLQVISPGYTTFLVFVFINALGTAGVYPLAFIIGIELVGKKKREITGIVLNYFYAVGEALVALIAWMVKDWVLLQLIVSAPPFLFIIYYWFVPESVRWLLAREKSNKAKKIVCKAAKVNNVVLSENLMNSFKNQEQLPLDDVINKTEGDMWPVLKALASNANFCIRFLIVYFIWAVNAFVYYGLSVNSVSMSGDKYLNFALVCLIEIPGYTLAWVCIHKIGRRVSLVGSLFLCGITCSLTLLVPTNMVWAESILFLTGKLGITSAFGIVYVHTAEMLPTIVRSGGVGSASTVARAGALVAPFVPLLGIYVQPLPMLLFGSVAVLAGLLALKLPETNGKKLPETVEDALNL